MPLSNESDSTAQRANIVDGFKTVLLITTGNVAHRSR